jgi:hypothetical protein
MTQALDITIDAKTQYPSACNAVETLLVHAGVASSFLPKFAERAKAESVELRLDDASSKVLGSGHKVCALFVGTLFVRRFVQGAWIGPKAMCFVCRYFVYVLRLCELVRRFVYRALMGIQSKCLFFQVFLVCFGSSSPCSSIQQRYLEIFVCAG